MTVWHGIKTIAAKDIRTFFYSPLFYLLGGLSSLIWSYAFFSGTVQFAETLKMASTQGMGQQGLNIHDTLFNQHFTLIHFLFLLFTGAITMRLVAEEKRNRTFDLLWTSPISSSQIIIGKLLAGGAVIGTWLLISAIYPLSMSFFTEIDWGPLFSSYLMLLLLGLVYVSIGLFASSITSSLVLSMLFTFVLYLGLLFISVGGENATNTLFGQIVERISIYRLFNEFATGMIRLSSVIAFLSLIIFWLVLANGGIRATMAAYEGRKLRFHTIVCLALAFLGLCISGITFVIFDTETIFGYYQGSEYISILFFGPILLAAILVIAIPFIEREFVSAFFMHRSTANGISTGLVIIATTLVLALVNFAIVYFDVDPKWDLTPNKVHSLASQTENLVKGLKNPVKIVFLYRNEEIRTQAIEMRQLIQKFENTSSKVIYEEFNLGKRPDLVSSYGLGGNESALYLVQGERKERITGPTEEAIASAIADLTKDKELVAYFTTGHGEPVLDATGQASVKTVTKMKEHLESLKFTVKPLNLIDTGQVPDDATFVAIVGPEYAFSDGEIEILRQYARAGGRLFIAADPLVKHGLAQLMRLYGIEFKNTVIFDPRGSGVGLAPMNAIGQVADIEHEITRYLPKDVAIVLHVSSPIAKAADFNSSFKYNELVKTPVSTVAKTGLSMQDASAGQGPFTVGVAVEGSFSGAPPASANSGAKATDAMSSAVIFGDSDFVTDQESRGNNPAIALMSMKYLARDARIMGLPPRVSGTTQLMLTSTQLYGLLALMVLIPIVLFGTGTVVWLVRRAA